MGFRCARSTRLWDAERPAGRMIKISVGTSRGSMERISFDEKTTYGIASDQAGRIFWTEEAKTVLKAAPSFVRGMVRKRAEAHARDQGKTEITGEMMHTLRKEAMSGRIGNVPSFVRKMMAGRSGDSAE